jgi:hypothetical protein
MVMSGWKRLAKSVAGRYNYKTVDNILKNNLDKLPYDGQPELFQPPVHPNVRGADNYQ